MKSKNMFRSKLVVLGALVLCLFCACEQKPKIPEEIHELNKKLKSAAAMRKDLEAEYNAMPVAELVKRLEIDASNDVEPFNSLSYRELVSRGRGVAEELKSQIKDTTRSSFLMLLALRKIDMDVYLTLNSEMRIRILTDALSVTRYYNSWGIPHLYWEDAAKAIIDHGMQTLERLEALLHDKRRAPIWGSEEALEYEKYKYRVCDYAWAMILKIKGEEIEIPKDPDLRDKLISNIF